MGLHHCDERRDTPTHDEALLLSLPPLSYACPPAGVGVEEGGAHGGMSHVSCPT